MLFSTRISVRVRVRVGISFSVWLVGGYAHVFELLSVCVVTLPLMLCFQRYVPVHPYPFP